MLTFVSAETIPAPTSPVLIWASIIAGTLIVLSAAFPKILGPISQGLSEWLSSSRARAVAKDEAEIADREREAAYWRGVADTLRAEIVERDRLIAAHLPFDYKMLEGHKPPYTGVIPPLYPTRLPTTHEVLAQRNKEGS